MIKTLRIFSLTLVSLILSSFSFGAQILMDTTINLKNGDYSILLFEVNGDGSGDFRPGVVLCNADENTDKYIVGISRQQWPVVRMRGSASNSANVLDIQTSARKNVLIKCNL